MKYLPLFLLLASCSIAKKLPPLQTELHLDSTPPSAVFADSHRNVFVLFQVDGRGALMLDGEALIADDFHKGEWLLRIEGGKTVRGKAGDPLPAEALTIRPAAFYADLGLTVK